MEQGRDRGVRGAQAAEGDSPPVNRGRKLGRWGTTDIWVWQGDITAAGTEAIVNAANNQGWLGSGVAGAIRRAAGDQVKADLHAAAMAPGRPASADAVGTATAAALRLAAAEGLTSVALPALGTGVGGVGLEAAAAAMGAAVRDHAAERTPVTTVVFALYDRAALERFAPALERALGGGHGA